MGRRRLAVPHATADDRAALHSATIRYETVESGRASELGVVAFFSPCRLLPDRAQGQGMVVAGQSRCEAC